MNQEKIGSFISKKRKEKKLTQEGLAEKLGVSKNAVSKWERGICLMDMSLLKPLSEILDVSINEILNGEEIKEEELKSKTDEVLNNTIDYSNKKLKKFKHKVLIITFVILFLIFLITFIVDYRRIKKNMDPLFMIPVRENGRDYTYLGFGYKMQKKASVSPIEPLSSSEEIHFGLWIFMWKVPVFNTKPYNVWVINGEKRVLMNIGSYCITDEIDGEKASECGDAIPPEDMQYKDILETNKMDTMALDSNRVSITNVRFYSLSGDEIKVLVSHEKYSFVVPDLYGEYIVLIATYSKRGSSWYSFKININ